MGNNSILVATLTNGSSPSTDQQHSITPTMLTEHEPVENNVQPPTLQDRSLHLMRRISHFFLKSTNEKANSSSTSDRSSLLQNTHQQPDRMETNAPVAAKKHQEPEVKPIYAYCVVPNTTTNAKTRLSDTFSSKLFSSLKLKSFRTAGKNITDNMSAVEKNEPLSKRYISLDDDDDGDVS